MLPLGLLPLIYSLSWAVYLVSAQTISANLTAASFSPPGNWFERTTTLCSPDEPDDWFTNVTSSTLTVNFFGSNPVVTGLRSNVTGVFTVTIDGRSFSQTGQIPSSDPTCNILWQNDTEVGNHTLSITLVSLVPTSNPNRVGSDPGGLDIVGVKYVAGTPTTSSLPSATSTTAPTPAPVHHSSNAGAIAGGVVGGVVGLGIVGFLLFCCLRRIRTEDEHVTPLRTSNRDMSQVPRHSSEEAIKVEPLRMNALAHQNVLDDHHSIEESVDHRRPSLSSYNPSSSSPSSPPPNTRTFSSSSVTKEPIPDSSFSAGSSSDGRSPTPEPVNIPQLATQVIAFMQGVGVTARERVGSPLRSDVDPDDDREDDSLPREAPPEYQVREGDM